MLERRCADGRGGGAGTVAAGRAVTTRGMAGGIFGLTAVVVARRE
jgi:hypothetical protein